MNLPPRLTDSEIDELVEIELSRVPTNCVRPMFGLIYTVPVQWHTNEEGFQYAILYDDSVGWIGSGDHASWPDPAVYDSLDIYEPISYLETPIDAVLVNV